MSRRIGCQEVVERSLAAEYLADRMAEDEEAAFEEHYLTCARCQEELRLAAALRSVLDEPGPARRPRRRLALGLAAAAALAALFLARSGGPPPGIAELGAVHQPPIYLPVPVRAEVEPADSLFDRAMRHYDAGRYGEAIEGLEAAIEAGADPAPSWFFLGASRLMEDRPRDAAEAFRRVLDASPNPYVPEAHYYQAKALLRLGVADEAAAHLRRVDESAGALAARAAALADTVEARRRR